jgi:hypothetical protein
MPTQSRGHGTQPWYLTLTEHECRTILLVIWDALWVQLSERESDRRSSYYA